MNIARTCGQAGTVIYRGSTPRPATLVWLA